MNATTKTKEVDISNENRTKLAKIEDYWSEKQTTEILNLLKEYHDVFSWSYEEIPGINPCIVEHEIKTYLNVKLV